MMRVKSGATLSAESGATLSATPKWLRRVSLAVGLALWGSPAFAVPLESQPVAGIHGFSSAVLAPKELGATAKNDSAPYIPPPDAGTPEPTGGTGSRGGCAEMNPPLAGLVGQSHLMLTTRERPVFWIYVPYTPEAAPSGFISLQQGENAVYEGEFSLAATPGVVGIRLPETAPALAAGQEYDWFIDIHCVANVASDQRTKINPGSLNGLVQRVEVSDGLAGDLNRAQTGIDRVAAYGRHHIWYDWLTELARLRLVAGDNGDNLELETIWTTVLSDPDAVLLDRWATKPLVGEVVPEKR